jgi:hypothetical protein
MFYTTNTLGLELCKPKVKKTYLFGYVITFTLALALIVILGRIQSVVTYM